MTKVDEKLQNFKECYVRHALVSDNLGMVLYSNDDKHELYEFFVDDEEFIIEEESRIASMNNDFEFTEEMFEERVEQRSFELSQGEEKEKFKSFPTILADIEEFKTKRPHLLYKNNEVLTSIETLISDDETKRHRCGNCGYPYFQSWTQFEYQGGEEGIEAIKVSSQEDAIVCSCCGRAVENPTLFIGGMNAE